MLLSLKIVLLQRQLHQKELAHGIGVSESRLSRIIRGRARAHARERRLIAEKLGVRETEIFPRGHARQRANGLTLVKR